MYRGHIHNSGSPSRQLHAWQISHQISRCLYHELPLSAIPLCQLLPSHLGPPRPTLYIKGWLDCLEYWADGVTTLATRAFREVPEQFANKQTIIRFCQGLIDKEAGHQVGTKDPKSTEEAMNSVKWYQYVHQSMYTDNHPDSRSIEYEDPVTVYKVGRGGSNVTPPTSQMENLQDDL